ncbi:hypothetical protein C2G38_2261358 [Gigaspora rosea]|uniref:Uncharacterized protein n=1 Tax=Gigaspora rosea TaxID=44941 RepID=A0A397W423_9GLOM|nr:hypothetical protein C2G38_2261358 [Gigaspora rosea]
MGCEESNYPEDPNIVLKDDSQIFKYYIIKEGVYPPKHKLKYTRRPAKHSIPHNYIVQIMYSKKNYIVECSIYYVDDKPLYQIYFGKDLEKSVKSDQSPSHAAHLYCQALAEDISNENINAKNSKLSGPLLFGLRCKSVEAVRKTLPSNEFVQLKPFDNYSASTQRKRILGLEEQLREFVEEEKENFFHPNDSIVLKQAKFEINNCTLISIMEKAYRSLAKLDKSLIRAGAIYDMRQEITHKVNEKIPISLVDIDQPTIFEPITEEADITDPTIVSNVVTSIRKGGHRRITDILNYIIPLYVQKEVLKPDSTLYLRISGDGRNVGKKAKHVMLTVVLLNNLDKLHKPESHYTLVLFPGTENYYTLQNALAPLISDLQILSEQVFYEIGGRHWNVELYFSSDWKFLAICLGMNAANSKYFCPWCHCSKENLTNTIEYSIISKDMEKIKESCATFNGHIRPSLFNMIPIKHWVCDSLHVMLRITDRLWELFLSDLQRSELNENTQELILTEMKRLGVSFHFWIDQQTQSLKYTLLMGPDKLNILKNFDFTKFVSKDFS